MTRSVSCSNCNFENDEGNEFCINCGSSLDHSTAPSHKIINSPRVSVSGSYDAMPGAKKYGQEKKPQKILGIIIPIVFIIIIVAVGFYLYNNFFTPDSFFP